MPGEWIWPWEGRSWAGKRGTGKGGAWALDSVCAYVPVTPFPEGVDPQVLPVIAGFRSDRRIHRDYWCFRLNHLQSVPWKTDFSPNSYPAWNAESKTEHVISDYSLLPRSTLHIKPAPKLLEHHVPFLFWEVIAMQFVTKMKSPFLTTAS